MISNMVVARHKKGSLIKGFTTDFSPNDRFFHMKVARGEKRGERSGEMKEVKIDAEKLKAAFFVKDFSGNKFHSDVYKDDIDGKGRKVEVTFFDGEVIIGSAMSYFDEFHGFFMVPADMKCNNERVFVVCSATESIRLY